MKEKNKSQFFFITAEFLAVFSVVSIVSNALYSISTILFIIAVLVCMLHNKREVIFPDRSFSLIYCFFFFCIILSSLLIGYKDSLLKSLDFTYWSIIPFILFYFGLQKNFHKNIVVGAIVCGVYVLCSYALYQFWVLPSGSRIESYLSHPNYLCEMLELSLPFLIFATVSNWLKKEKVKTVILGCTSLICCFVISLTASRGGILGICIGGVILLLVHAFYIKKINIHKSIISIGAVLIVILGISGIFFYNFGHTQISAVRSYDGNRILFWKSSYEMWKDHKVLGVGLRHWEEQYTNYYISPEVTEHGTTYPHNTFVYFFSSAGLIGGIGFLFFTFGIFLYLCWKLKKNPDNLILNALLWSFLAIMIHGVVNAAILSKFVMRLYSSYLGIGLASVVYQQYLLNERQENNNSSKEKK